MNLVYMNVFHRSEKKLVALCDVDVLGKTFKEGKLKLEVKEGFYRGTLTTMDKAMEELHEADIGNLVGRNVVGAAIERGLVNPKAVIYISGTPHVQILRL